MVVPESLWIRLRLDQGRSNGLQVGLPAQIVRRSQPGVPVAGKVARVEPLADSVTEERMAQVSFDTLPEGLAIGEMVEVSLQLPTVKNALLVPGAALRHRGGVLGVWRLKEGELSFAPVKTGAIGNDGSVQIHNGLAAGDSVVVYSERDLTASSRIKIVSALAGQGK
jgi:HlyD family secretion protein